MHPGDRFRELARILLDEAMPPYSLGPEVKELSGLLGDIATVRPDPRRISPEGETRTAHGLALSPTMAARCADDIARTVVFTRGVAQAIREAEDRTPDRRVRVLYAGCGPYALLVLGAMASIGPDELHVTLLDIHEPSVVSARTVLDALGLSNHIDAFVTADACTYAIPPNRLPDIVLSETMNACLEKEPQVAIARHLMTQAPGATLIPESVRIDAFLIDPNKEYGFVESEGDDDSNASYEPDRIPLGTVFELNAESIRAWADLEGDRLPARSLQIPDVVERRYDPALYTTVTVFGDHVLRVRDSGLTLPKPLPIPGALHGGEMLRFHYLLGSAPGLVCKITKG